MNKIEKPQDHTWWMRNYYYYWISDNDVDNAEMAGIRFMFIYRWNIGF